MDHLSLPIWLAIIAVGLVFWYYRRKRSRYVGDSSTVIGSTPDTMGGWLAWFCILLALSSINAVLDFNASVRSLESKNLSLSTVPSWVAYQHYCWLFIGSASLFCLIALWRLGRVREWSSVMSGMAAAAIIGPLLAIMCGLVIPWVTVGRTDLDAELFLTILKPSIWAAIWITYLSKSKRVRARYGLAPWH